ncbi:ATP-binding protein [Burkholderia pseudomallei]|uniref:ATP-binding protein n=1 Tax=Burkholderia pseudomallei TaxID=28450 RepID=UPI00050F21D3|nr:AAA family ATPase [Burkholderia pseudomallei]KGD08640.1 AAA domain protein [Burkholderia pseudomallei]
MIEKIDIKSFGCFSDFAWNTEVRDHGNNVAKFKKMNVIYGRNYSGKTTLSRIIRSLETGSTSPRYASPSFSITISGAVVTNNNIPAQGHDIRVYNKDFVDEHLAFLRDEQGHISPFAVLGSKNKEIEVEIDKLEDELGSVENKTGLRHSYQEKKKEHADKKKAAKDAQDELDKKIFDKANKNPTGIKHNSLYKDANYDVRKLKSDIKTVQDKKIAPLDDADRSSKVKLLSEVALPDIEKRLSFNSSLPALVKSTVELITKKIKPSAPIQELLNDAILQNWVKSGIPLHEATRETCGFCGSPLPADLWKRLGDHFNQESQDLEKDLDSVLTKISNEKTRIKNVVTVERKNFYSANQATFDNLKADLEDSINNYEKSLQSLEDELNARKKDIFTERSAIDAQDNTAAISKNVSLINELIERNNKITTSLEEDQKIARNELRLSEISQFTVDIDLAGEEKKIKALEDQITKAKEELDAVEAEGKKRVDRVKELRTQLRDEKRGAEQVNQHLGHFLGHGGLSLSAVEEANTATYRFQILRGDQVAYNLSEGECSLVAFCYFLAKLEDIETKGKKLIIYIDDPISSLDSNHIFFVFSLIENYITKPIEDANGKTILDGNGKPTYRYEQLFISTHNLEFLKYLKRLTKPAKDSESFLITRKQSSSAIGLMPTYLRNYITELNYLFGEIYCCSDANNSNSHYHSFYNFGNNLRKFLEAFLFFKYPFSISDRTDHDKRIKMFFHDGTNSQAFVERLTNEFSHLGEFIDRGAQPIDCAEIAAVAKFVLKRIRDNDKEQFDHFLLSIERTDPFAQP